MLQRTFLRRFHFGLCVRSGSSKSSDVKNLLDNSASFDDLKNNSPESEWSTLPYTEGSIVRHEHIKEPVREKQDPRDTSIIIFPGQGAHHVGMCKNLMKFPGARDIFELANHVLQ